MISKCSSAGEVKKAIRDKQWIQYIGPSIHNMFADLNGSAIVTETDNKQNLITEIEDNFIVMSNFANHSLVNKSYKEAVGTGADRYMTAHDYIIQNRHSFSLDKGFELLKKVALNDLDCSTLCSMVFDPQTNNIYISIHRNFEKMWKVSLDSQTIETYRGYKKDHKIRLENDGILSTDLKEF